MVAFSLLLSGCAHIQFSLFLKTNGSSVQPVSFRRIINPFAVLFSSFVFFWIGVFVKVIPVFVVVSDVTKIVLASAE